MVLYNGNEEVIVIFCAASARRLGFRVGPNFTFEYQRNRSCCTHDGHRECSRTATPEFLTLGGREAHYHAALHSK
jgi:hypothetical protein